MMTSIEGGCFCGAVRYRATEQTDSVAHCHCQHCRAASGATLMTWVEVPRTAFAWTRGEPAAYEHDSDWKTPVVRRFCAQCGTSLTYERTGSTTLDVSVGSLDEPAVVTPAHHVYDSSRLDWFEVADELPRYEKGRPDSQ
jgi:hypothetical protein